MIPVVFSTDHNFIMPTGVAMLSMFESNKDRAFDIYILQNRDVEDKDRKCFTDMAERFSSRITYINPGDCFEKSYEVRGISKACYYRLLIPWLIPQHDKIIYLDGDLIVKGDINSMLLLASDNNNMVYGVRTPGFTLDTNYISYIKSLGLNNHKYINTGVLIFNSKQMRESNLRSELLSFTDKKLLFQDQDIINIICKNRIGWLPLQYNSSPSLLNIDSTPLIEAGITTDQEFVKAIAAPTIIHYAGPKPWKTFTHHWYDWWSVYSRSPFYDYNYTFDLEQKVLHPRYTIRQLLRMMYHNIKKS